MKENLRFRFALALLFLSNTTANFLQAQGCPGLSSVTINVVAAPEPEIDGPASFCAGGSSTLTVTSVFENYSWSTGESTQSITVTNPGSYSVTVTNAAGCTGTDDFVVDQAPAPVPSISQAPYACNGQLTLDAGSGFATYNWSTGENINPITVNSSGTYSVTVTNAAGCSGTASFVATIPSPPVVTVTGDTEFCANATTTLDASPGLSSYAWSSGQNTPTITVNSAGAYTVTATDAFGCTATATATVTTLPAPIPDITGPAAVCTGESSTFTVTGTFNTYLWSTGDNGPSITVNSAGTYSVTVSDANGCTGMASETLNLLPLPQPVIGQSTYQCDGQLVLNAGGGFSNYNWSNGLSGNPVTVDASGTYFVTVTDNNGCTGTASYFADIPADPVVAITGNNQYCEGQGANLEATPGLVNYVWSNGLNGPSITVVNPGTYTVTATDAFGCTASAGFDVDELPAPQPSIDGPGAFCAFGSATLDVPGIFNNYNWSSGQNGPTITVTVAGNYTVTVTDNNGCTGTDSETLIEIPAPQPAVTAAPYQCDGVLTLQAAGGFSSYAWSTGQNENPITVNTPGNYLITVTDNNGCTGVEVFFADIPAAPVVAVSGINQFCEGSGTALEATPGFNFYVWSTAQTGQSITVSAGGTYSVTATDGFGCTATDDYAVTEWPAPAPAISGPASVCQGLTATFATQGGFNAYVWSTGNTDPSITVGAAGVYGVTVTDANGCTGEDDAALNVLPAPQPTIAADPYACNGQLTLNAGGGFSAYAWSTGQSGSSITVNTPDDYGVTVTGANGCTGTDLFTADIPADPVVGITGNPSFCQGAGSVLTASAGLNAYVWSTGETDQSITVTQTGNYEVTATDGFGCTATDVLSVQALNNPTPNIGGPATICVGGSATFTVPGAFNAYNWSTGESTQSITVSAPGTYSVTVTAANGCTGADAQTLSLSTSLEPEIAEQPYNCDGQIALDAGAGFSTYLWSGGQSTQTISVNTPGDYTVTVTDATGCSGTDVISVSIPADPVVTVSGTPAICQNTSTSLSATPGLNSYAWSNGQVGPTITVSTADTYTVTATDDFGCTATDAFTLTVNPLPLASVSGPSIICINGSGTLSAPAGLSAYQWSTGEATPAITVTSAGAYSVTVTDANGCSNTAGASVTVAAQLDPQINAQPYDCDGQIGLDAGTGFSSYVWSSGQNTPAISAVASGTYSVTVTDANGCTGADTVAVNVPTLPTVSIAGNTAFCAGSSTALSATPGFVSYAWSTGENTPDINTGTGGTVSVTVTDASGCTASSDVLLTPQALPTPAISGPAAVCAGNDAVLSVGASFAAVVWSTGAATNAISVGAAGTYGVTVTDANGCTGSTSADLLVNSNPTPQIIEAPYACDGQIGLDAGTGFSSYAWSSGQNTPAISAAQSGAYSVTVTDANGCTGLASTTVDVPVLNQVTIGGTPQFCAGTGTSLDASSGFVSYEWSNAETTANIAVTQPGTYSVTATDALGCTSIAGIDVLELQTPQPAISGPQSVCPGSTATFSVVGGFVAYQWSTGAATQSITVLPPASVSLTVTDGNGCTGTATADVIVSNQLVPVIVATPLACTGQVSLDAGSGYQNYQWSTGDITSQIVVAQAGNYSVTVNDGNGCTGSAQAAVTLPDIPVVAISGDNAACPGETAALQASPGFVQYLWSNGATGALVNVPAGVYDVTATDGNGCTATASYPVDALPAPAPAIFIQSTLCSGGSAVLAATQSYAGYLWSTGAITPVIQVGQPGAYGLTVTDQNGCTGAAQTQLNAGSADTTLLQALTCNPNNVGTAVQTLTGVDGCDSVVITQTTLGGAFDASIEIDSDFNGFGVSCSGATDGFATGIPQGGQAPFQFQWSNGASSATAANIGAGVYTVTITDAAGCSGTATAELLEPEPVVPVIQALGPTCSSPGAITVQSVGGGLAPYTVRLFQEVGVTNGTQALSFDDLDEGTFTVEVTDANGCTAEELVVLTPIEVINEVVGDTIDIFPGDTVTLNAPITITPVDITWTAPTVDLSCADCLNPSLAPLITTEVQLFVQGYGACTAEGRFVIRVKTGKQVFIPNVITPESGDQNAWFTLYGDESVVSIRSLQVYDRWGGKMAVFQDILPNRPEMGWDGRFQGDLMMPGVYVYWAEVEYADGTTQVFSGDVTLVR